MTQKDRIPVLFEFYLLSDEVSAVDAAETWHAFLNERPDVTLFLLQIYLTESDHKAGFNGIR